MPKTATEVIEDVFALAAADEGIDTLAEPLRELWESDSWNEESISAAFEAEGENK
jgi:hypothetical protein